jgi:putative addiction module component (TIGR02574 family)
MGHRHRLLSAVASCFQLARSRSACNVRGGLDRAILVDQSRPERRQRGAAAMASTRLSGDDRLAEAVVHVVDQEPCPAIRHAELDARLGDRSGVADRLQQPDLTGANRPLPAEIDAQGQSRQRLCGSHRPASFFCGGYGSLPLIGKHFDLEVPSRIKRGVLIAALAEGITELQTCWEDCSMSLTDLAELLKLPAGERAELAITLWESLTDAEREAELELGPELRVELDRRCAEHEADPRSAIPWHSVRRKLADGT